MIAIEKLRMEHYDKFAKLQEIQSLYNDFLTNEEFKSALVNAGFGYAAISGDRVIAIAGITPLWEGRAHAWTLISEYAGQDMFALVSAFKRFLDNSGFRRIEAAVDSEFPAGHRLMRILGFRPEGVMMEYSADRRDHILYARVR